MIGLRLPYVGLSVLISYYLKGSAGRWNSIQQDQWWYDRTDSKLNKIFNKGMFDHSTFAMKKILEIYGGFEGLKTLVDVGGWYRSHV